MLDNITRARRALLKLTMDDARAVISTVVPMLRGRGERMVAALAEHHERVHAAAGDTLLQDGRELLWVGAQAWVLRPEIHAQRLAGAMEQARQRDAAIAAQRAEATARMQEQPSICTALIDGQLCGGTLIRAAVCPRCALGKSGVAATLTCDVCGHVTAIMQGGCNG